MSSLEIVNPLQPLYVVDTHALIWYLTDEQKLGVQASAIFAAAERGETLLVVPVIVVAEMYYANAKFQWFGNFAAVYLSLQAQPYFRLVTFEPDQVLDFDIDGAVPEMHDRIIIGVARRLGAPLLSRDLAIVQAQLVPIIW